MAKYQRGAYPSSELGHSEEGDLPEVFKVLVELDVKLAGLYVSFVSELGKYYLFSRFDKKDIDAKKYIAYLQLLQAAVPRREEHRDENKPSTGESSWKKPSQEAALGEKKKKEDPADAVQENEPDESLEELLEKLNTLIGLAGVKQEVTTLINLIKVNKIRESRGFNENCREFSHLFRWEMNRPNS